MQSGMQEGFVELLEALASRYYPGLFAVIDDTMEELLGRPGLRVHIMVGHSPSMHADGIVAIAMVSPTPLPSRSLPQDWQDILEASKNKPLRVDLFVLKGDAVRAQTLARDLNPRALVIPLPPGSRKAVVGRTRRKFQKEE